MLYEAGTIKTKGHSSRRMLTRLMLWEFADKCQGPEFRVEDENSISSIKSRLTSNIN